MNILIFVITIMYLVTVTPPSPPRLSECDIVFMDSMPGTDIENQWKLD